jgi:hypothetical protein
MYVHCRKIYNLFVALETGRKVSFSSLFCSEYKIILNLPTMYISCVYFAMAISHFLLEASNGGISKILF